MENKYFIHRIKRNGGTITKGILVADTYDIAKQKYRAYLEAYAYGHEKGTDFVSCMVSDLYGAILLHETWNSSVPV